MKENNSCKATLFADVCNKASGKDAFVLAASPYLYWWTTERDALAASNLEAAFFIRQTGAGKVKECTHCKRELPRGQALKWIKVAKEMYGFWSHQQWNKRKDKGTDVLKRQCHQCRHKQTVLESSVRMQCLQPPCILCNPYFALVSAGCIWRPAVANFCRRIVRFYR